MLWLAAQLDELNPQHVLGFGGDAVALVQPHAADPDDILLIGKHQHVALGIQRHFFVNQEIADLFLPIHPQRLEPIPFAPGA